MRSSKPDRLSRRRLIALLTGGVVLVAGLLIAKAHFRLALVMGNSMLPSLHTGNLLLVDKHAYQTRDPQRGDIVVARYGRELIIKRVVGLPGEEVALRAGHLYINGVAVREKHAIEPGRLDIAPGTLMAGRYALLGDNRGVSGAEFVHAVLPKNKFIGKVIGSLRL